LEERPKELTAPRFGTAPQHFRIDRSDSPKLRHDGTRAFERSFKLGIEYVTRAMTMSLRTVSPSEIVPHRLHWWIRSSVRRLYPIDPAEIDVSDPISIERPFETEVRMPASTLL
jgi:hypothetical protein